MPQENIIKPGWSAAEKWIVIGIILIVVSVILPIVIGMETNRRDAMARRDLRMLITACERFFLEYGAWPSPHMGAAGDMRYGREIGNELVVNALRAVDGPGNEGHRLNPNRIEFIQLSTARRGWSGVDEAGAFLDPWGMPYQLVLDTDLNNVATMSQTIYRNQSGVGSAAWSYGPDRRPDTERDILSWLD